MQINVVIVEEGYLRVGCTDELKGCHLAAKWLPNILSAARTCMVPEARIRMQN
jgi:hypothetical protein